MTIPEAFLLFFAALLAGALNSVAGGGSFFTFPALLFTGVPPIPANATSTVAVWPGSVASAVAYRKKLPRNASLFIPLLAASIAGGITGAVLLLHTPQEIFMRLIPALFFAATLFFAFGKKLFRAANPGEHEAARPSWLLVGAVSLLQFATGVYGGFFGGGMGILMLAFLTILPLGDIHSMNSVKTVLGTAINGVAIIAFVLARIIFWQQGVLMLVGAVLGGYGGAHYAQKINPGRVRTFVVVVGFTMSFIFLWKYR
ncbi:MAG TPA: sulfite exporter TauE/SafE family protein [Terriglobia bacterium]|nr:sulfite exporter TauE/SafE family protein [Terriglobia bacterium]